MPRAANVSPRPLRSPFRHRTRARKAARATARNPVSRKAHGVRQQAANTHDRGEKTVACGMPIPERGHVRTVDEMRTLVTGVSGYVGATLAPMLAREGHEVRGFARSRERVATAGVVLDDVVVGDALTGAGLEEAVEGVGGALHTHLPPLQG